MVVDGVSANFLFLRRAIEVSLVAENHIDGKLQKQICHLDANGEDVFPSSGAQSLFHRNKGKHCRNLRSRR